jgi:hypothetical protein
MHLQSECFAVWTGWVRFENQGYKGPVLLFLPDVRRLAILHLLSLDKSSMRARHSAGFKQTARRRPTVRRRLIRSVKGRHMTVACRPVLFGLIVAGLGG